MINKKIVFTSIIGIIAFALGIFFIFFNTYTISGKIIDFASKEAVKDVKVNIGSITTTTNKEGSFQLKNIKKYQSGLLEIKVPAGYEELAPILPKEDIQNIAIYPTLETMVNRTDDASRNGQHDYLWDYMHPDDQSYWESKENYSTTFKKLYEIAARQGSSSPIFEIGKNIRKLDTWTHKITGKEYTDVMEVPVENKANGNNNKIELQYFQKVDGAWRYFTGTNKEEAKKFIDQYSSLISINEPQELVNNVKNDDSPMSEKETLLNIFAIGETSELNNYVLTINSVTDCTNKDGYSRPKEGYKYVVADITLGNDGTVLKDYNAYNFSLQDNEKYSYQEAISCKEPSFGSGSIQPSMNTRGFLTFEIPTNNQPDKLIFTPYQSNGKQIIVKIK